MFDWLLYEEEFTLQVGVHTAKEWFNKDSVWKDSEGNICRVKECGFYPGEVVMKKYTKFGRYLYNKGFIS